MSKENINIVLTKDEAIVLDNLLSRFSETDKLDIVHKAERVALWNLCCLIEKEISEPLDTKYNNILDKARENLLK